MKKTIPIILRFDESFDVGWDRLTGVNDLDYQQPFPLTGKLNTVWNRYTNPVL